MAREHFRFEKKQDAPTRVCLVYPNRYAVAMGNLGFQAVYEIFDQADGVVCERAFLPDAEEGASGNTLSGSSLPGNTLRSLENARRVRDFDIVAFSISFETDYLHVLPLLDAIGVTARRSERSATSPLLIAGGPAIFLNPEPIADFFDLFLIGEAEEMLPEFLALHAEHAKRAQDTPAFLCAVEQTVAGAYVPGHFEATFDGDMQTGLEHDTGRTGGVERRLVWDLNRFSTTTRVLTDEAVFGDMVMVEASRGCQWGCRFCAAGFMYRPIRTRDPDVLAESVSAGLKLRDTIGLVGAEMASVPGVERLSELAASVGGRISPSSLKADCVTPGLATALAGGGTRSVTVAPEAGSDRMRRVINKNLSEEDILRAADLLVGEGVRRLKLYFMVGLPTELDEDVAAIADLAERIRDRLSQGGRGRVGGVTLSVNPFVPKPWTPFQWDPMESIPSLRKKMTRLRGLCRRIPKLRFDADSPREGYLQTLLSRGDRRIARVLEAIHAADGDWWRVIRVWQRQGIAGVPHPDHYVHRELEESEFLPWDFIDHRIAKSYLQVERRKALASRQTAPCDTATCTSCTAC